MKAKLNSETLKSKRGFTLLEVMVAICILAMFLVPLLAAVIGGMRNLERARNMQTARELALNKLEEIKVTTIPEMEQEIDGDFSPQHPEYRYKLTYQKNPELALLEQQIEGLVTMEVELVISWPEGEEQKELKFKTILAQ